jgi:hypothetical protein
VTKSVKKSGAATAAVKSASASKTKTVAKTGATKAAAKPASASKTKANNPTLNKEIQTLLKLVSGIPALTFPELKSAAKLYELAVLAELLLEFQASTTGTISLEQPTAGAPNTFAGAPASADKKKYSWFRLTTPAKGNYAEAWVSVQFVGISAELVKKKLPASVNQKASSHEFDISLIKPEPTGVPPRLYPRHSDLLAAVSVKHVSNLAKEAIREALGFRREMGYLRRGAEESKCDWLVDKVPCDPATPLFLLASAENFKYYDGHIDELGVYPGYLRFPY